MADTLITRIQTHIGTSTERAAMSTTGLPLGSTFYETDTTLTKIWDLSVWQLYPEVSPGATGAVARKTAAFAVGAGTGSIGTFALFTVTGAVKINIIATCSETLVGAATLECGYTGATAAIIAQIADATALVAGEIWFDATPTTAFDTIANGELSYILGNGQDIFLTIGAANITDGTIDFNIVWWPLSVTGSLVAA